MSTGRDTRGKFVKGNVMSRKRASLAKTGGFLSTRQKKKIERELQEYRRSLEEGIKSAGPREKSLVDQAISQRRMVIYFDSSIKKFTVIDFQTIEMQLKVQDAERKTLDSLRTERAEKVPTLAEKIAEFEAEKARKPEEEDLEEGEHGIL